MAIGNRNIEWYWRTIEQHIFSVAHRNGKRSMYMMVHFSYMNINKFQATIVHFTRPFEPNKWIRLTVVYDTMNMLLYVNGARVGRSDKQVGHSCTGQS